LEEGTVFYPKYDDNAFLGKDCRYLPDHMA
jgi:hypothetical protein